MLHGPRPRRRALPLALAAAVAALAAATTVSAAAGVGGPSALRRGPRGVPARLADTGLYSDLASRTVDPRNVHYTPQYPLWSDGAAKSRWIRLPPGTAVDARHPDGWVFPVGTRIWKEFAWSRRVETRYMELTRRGWIYASYRWTDDGSDAVLAPEGGATTDTEVAPGRRHAIPSVADCLNCHRGGRAEVLGFSALQLSPDRDPLAPNAEPLQPGDPTLPALAARGLVRRLPPALLREPPRVPASSPRGRAALGYLHANCSICHDSRGPLASLGVSLRHSYDARSEREEPAEAAVGRPTRWRAAGAIPGVSAWIRPGAPAASALLQRMASRSPLAQMPPLGTQLADEQAVALVRAWIEEDLASPEEQHPK